mgnify:CR=1 FL=1
MIKYEYKLDFEVRDYECDVQGVVNNAVYQNYLEVTRNKWLYDKMGLKYSQMTSNKQYLFVARIEIDYKYPLRMDDRFWVGGIVRRTSNVKLNAIQDIYKYDDNLQILKAKLAIVGVTDDGRFGLPKNIIERIPLSK